MTARPPAADGLVDHLLSAHRRTPGDLAGLPPAEVHSFEHLEQALGLLELDHTHDGADAPEVAAPAAGR
jgi:hypothetical protein